MDPNLFEFIFRRSKREQGLIVLASLLALPLYYVSLEMPKLIVNKALGANVSDFPHAMRIFDREIVHLEQMGWLVVLCSTFLVAVLIHGGIKFFLNGYKGRLGETLLRDLRHELCARVLRFPMGRFRRVSSDELNAMITGELEPLGGFIGDSIALPVLQGGLLVTAVAFIIVQDPVLGLAAVALFPVQGFVIPKLQRQINALSRKPWSPRLPSSICENTTPL